ncbi:MAG: hypothetical protein R2796_03070 [Chitinophagaceae bacterium]
MKKLKIITALFLFSAIFIGCKKNKMTTSKLNLNITGLQDLGANYKYEGWIIVNGGPVSTGTFTVDGSGNLSKTSFDVDADQLSMASDFVLTIEPFPDVDPSPSSTHIVAGSFSGNTAAVSIADSKALGTNFASATGKYILATPTNGSGTNEKSGIWFLDLGSGSPMQGLQLPVLPSGWMYEGWTVIGGQPVTSGRFTSAMGADLSAPFSSTMNPGPPFPGEDYLQNAPSGLTFPTDISGGVAVISVEPEPDNSPMPFLLKPLVGMIPTGAMDHTTYNMSLNLSTLPSGTASR